MEVTNAVNSVPNENSDMDGTEINDENTSVEIVEVDFLWNRTVDSLKTSCHPLLWTSSGLKESLKDNTLYGEWQAH